MLCMTVSNMDYASGDFVEFAGRAYQIEAIASCAHTHRPECRVFDVRGQSVLAAYLDVVKDCRLLHDPKSKRTGPS